MSKRTAIVAGLLAATLLMSGNGPAKAADINCDNGWLFPYIGAGRGQWDASVGVFLWDNVFKTRNLQLRGDIDLAPGVRYHAVLRSNREQDTLSGFHPHFDENYVEGYGFHQDNNGTLSASLRVGSLRYLHFPYPDSIAIFDQVPGISDLRTDGVAGAKTGYSGGLMTVDYEHATGLGVHASAIRWGFGRDGGNQLLENYIFYHQDFGKLHFETHAGGLALRTEPAGQRATGFNVFLGTDWKKYSVGLLYEKLHAQSAYTGIMVTFPMDPVTKTMGRVAFDYDRSPQGFAMQIPLVSGTLGGVKRAAPAGSQLVGEVAAERVRTYWQNGQVRNYYEHRLGSWGETGSPDLIVVMVEDSWYLQSEALVSPHTFGAGFKTWEKDRQGPAQISQTVVYRFYRK